MINKKIGIIGAIILLSSLYAGFLKINYWYFPGVIGAWLFFSYLYSTKKEDSSINILKTNPKKILQIYFFMFLFGATIEIIGRIILNLWSYPLYNNFYLELLNLIFYPFILVSMAEMYLYIFSIKQNKFFSISLSMIIGFLIWEIPNIFSKDWIYYVNYLIVFVGWIILVIFPTYILNALKKIK